MRYIREPAGPNGHGTNRDPVNPARFRYSHTHTAAGQVQLPDHPGRHRTQPLIEHETRSPPGTGTPIGTADSPAPVAR